MHWVEIYIFTHDQFIFPSRTFFHTRWRTVYLVLTGLLFGILFIFYILLASDLLGDAKADLQLINVGQASANFALPGLFIITRVYFSWGLSGFGYSSLVEYRRLVKLNYLLLLWTIGRVVRAVEFIWDDDIQHLDSTFVAMILVASMIFCELLPFLFTMDWDIISLLLLANEAPALRRASETGDYQLIGEGEEKDLENSDKYHIQLADIKFLTDTEDSKENGKFCTLQTGKLRGKKVLVKSFRFVGLSPAMIHTLSEDLISNSTFDHERVAKFFGVFQNRCSISRITEYTEAGSLRDILRECNRPLAGTAILRLIQGICEGMEFLHSQTPPAIHAHLKTSNILITADMGVKITDLGLRRIKACMELTSIQRSFTAFTAPEIFAGETPTKKSDVYSFGWICWEFLSRTPPFANKDIKYIKEAVRKKKRPSIPDHDDLPAGFNEMIGMAWSHQPLERPEFEDLKLRVVAMTRSGATPLESIDEEKGDEARTSGGVVNMLRQYLFSSSG